MKILILTDRLDIGGAETHIAQLALELLKEGNEVAVASSGGKVADWLQALGILHYCMPLESHSPLVLLRMRCKIRTLIKSEGFAVAHAHARIPALLIRGLRHLNCAEIVTVHAKFRAGFLRRTLSYWGENCIAVSEDLRAYLHNVYKIPMQRISVIPNGIDLSHFYPSENKEARDSFCILFASRLDADCARGAELLLEIAPLLVEKIPNIHITIVGGGQKMPEIAQRASEINHSLGLSCLSVCGAVSDMAPLLQKQDVFVGVSRAALEALAVGCSVILCGNEGYGGILTTENFWQASLSNFCARDSDAPIANKLLADILTLAQSSEERKSNAPACRKLLEDSYDAASVCQKTLTVYQKSLHSSPRATVVIGGYFGCGNLGDDAILQAFIEYTHTHYPDMRILALTKHPRTDSRRFGVRCYNRKNPLSIAIAFLRANAFLCGGGSLLQNVTGKLSLYYYLCMLRLAKRCGALPILYAAGIGPINGKNAQHAVQKVLAECAYISLRDAESLRFLRTKNLDPAKLHLGADAALLLPPPPLFRTYQVKKRIDVAQNCPYVCICLKSGKQTADTCRTIVAALRMFCRAHNLLPVFLPLSEDDISINLKAAHRLGGKMFFADEPSDVSAILRDAHFVVSMRLHALILASTVSLPFVGIPTADDPKIPSFARLAAGEYLAPEEVTVAALVEIFRILETNGHLRRPLIANACRDLQKNAQKDLANIAAMVYNSGRYIKKSEDTL